MPRRLMRLVTRSVALLALLACGGDASPPQPLEPTGPVVTTIVVTAPARPLHVGATLALTADVREQVGAVMAGKTPTSSSGNEAIATVTNAGVVAVQGPV